MCGVSGIELLIIVVVAVMVLGPDRLPEVMRTLGKLMREVRKVTGEITSVRDEFTRSVRDGGKAVNESVERRAHAGRAGQDVSDIDAIRARKALKAAEDASVADAAASVAAASAAAVSVAAADSAANTADASAALFEQLSLNETPDAPQAPPAERPEPLSFRDVRPAQAQGRPAQAEARRAPAPLPPSVQPSLPAFQAPAAPQATKRTSVEDVRRALASDESPTGTRLMPRLRPASGAVAASQAGTMSKEAADLAAASDRELSRLRQLQDGEDRVLEETRYLSPQARQIAQAVAAMAQETREDAARDESKGDEGEEA